ncbi:MAG: hypothetical protein HC880_02080 [Bacteroidia bacterium]|nr:hypothetical protein [Bacteroidia bacterium]
MVIRWEKEINNFASGQVTAYDIQPCSDRGFIIVGAIQARSEENEAFIIKLNENGETGNRGWQRVISSTKNEYYTAVSELIEGFDTTYVAVGTVRVLNQTGASIQIDRYSSRGELLNLKVFSQECENCRANAAILIQENGEPKLIVAGTEIDNPALFRFGLYGNNVVFEGKSVLRNVQGNGLVTRRLSDGKFVLAGDISSKRSDSTHAFIAKFDIIRQDATPAWTNRVVLYNEFLAMCIRMTMVILWR